MNLVDSSGWLEYFSDGKNAPFFAPAIEDSERLLVPTICIYEVCKRIMIQRGENAALIHIGDMHHGKIIDFNTSIALVAAKLSWDFKIAMADSIVLATAQTYHATLWTQDSDFIDFEDVKFIEKVV